MLELSIIIGSMNVVKEGVDCLLAHMDAAESVNALFMVKNCFDIHQWLVQRKPHHIELYFSNAK